MTTDRLVAYVTDPGYMLPTLVSARQLADRHADRDFDIIIFTVSVPAEALKGFQGALSERDVTFIPIDPASFLPAAGTYFREGHVPTSTLARLVLGSYVPAQYQHIVYIDGDTQILGDVSQLVGFDVPEGQIAAVNDPLFLETPSPQRLAYRAGLGLTETDDYFNAGVLAFRKSSWAQIGPAALEFYLRNPTLCEFHDQSALNAVCRGRRVALAPAYNFQTGYAELGVGGAYRPRIVHFTGREKPWSYQAWPWNGRLARPYRDLLTNNPSLAFDIGVKFSSPARQLVRSLHKVVKYRRQHADLFTRRRKFFDYLSRTEFPFEPA